ncbi:hypothetical protein [Paracraurococcus lichenis]|uniref:Histidine kinase n=1 Tax=Paracraurococcus lichenis TaxID=3064888 RepID=A0ABT9E2U5_9PROT|nr:hypothetical protein [Paracraurococcus sp. LOR1-02]MDO9710325.1 hypothetical protein [Paracraurococcus sp. LOR1-02]
MPRPERLLARVAAWPAPTRDAGAAALALAGAALAQLLVRAGLPAEVFLAVPGVVLAGLVFGRGSSLFAALLTGAVIAAAFDPAAQQAVHGIPALPSLALALVCLAVALGTAALAAATVIRAQAKARERRARVLMEACARDALGQIEAARRRLATAEAEVTQARDSLAQAQATAAPGRDPLEEALRSEGGV